MAELLNAKGAAQIMGLPVRQIYRLTKNDPPEIPYHMIGSRKMFSREDLEEYIKNQRVRSAKEILRWKFSREDIVGIFKALGKEIIDADLKPLKRLLQKIKKGEELKKEDLAMLKEQRARLSGDTHGGYYLRGKTWTLYYYDEVEVRKGPNKGQVKYRRVEEAIPYCSCEDHAWLAWRIKEIELFKKWLGIMGTGGNPQQMNFCPTVPNGGTAEVLNDGVDGTIRFKDLAKKYEEIHLPTLAKTTQKYQRSFIRSRLVPFFGELPLNSIDSMVVKTFWAETEKEELPDNTKKTIYSILCAMFNRAIEWGMTEKANPVLIEKKKPFGPVESKGKYIPKEHREEMLKNAKAYPYLAPIILTALYSGGRLSECLNLECRDLDLKEEAVIYRKGLPGNKSKKTQSVKIPSKVFNVLKELVKGKDHNEKINLRDGKPIKTIRKAWQAVQNELPVRYRFHDLRHTFGSMLNEAGVDNKTKQEMLRHSSLSITEKYVHTTPEMHSKAAKKLEDF